MRGVTNLIQLSTLVLILGCTGSYENINGVDWEAWKGDRNGCGSARLAYLTPLKDQLGKLKKRSEMDIVELMGRPDETELYKRNQKFYTYFFDGGPECANRDSTSTRLVIRFNAMGLAKEVAVEEANQ